MSNSALVTGTASASRVLMRNFVLCLCLLATTACYRESPIEPGPVDQEVTLAAGRSTTIEGARVSVRFIGVSGDSRCPGDAICIHGGSATVRFEVTNGAGARRELTFETGNLQPLTYETLTVELLELMPYPFGSLPPIQPGDYRAKLRVHR
jgi:hypothetical protein